MTNLWYGNSLWPRLRAAADLAARAHAGQIDKGGEPYFWHAMRVGISLLPDVDAAIVGILHDVIEDQPAFTGEVWALLGKNPELLTDLEALTRHDGEEYDNYIARIAESPRATAIKRADIRDNLDPRRLRLVAIRCGAPVVAELQRKYELALSILFPSQKTFDISNWIL